MVQMNLSEAKARFSEVIRHAEAGEDVVLLRNGKPCAKVTAADRPRKPLDLEKIRAFRSAMPMSDVDSVDLIRQDARY